MPSWLSRRSSTAEGSSSSSALTLCSRSLSRKSWPCRKPSSGERQDFQDMEEISQPEPVSLVRRSLAGPPIGGGQFGSLLTTASLADLTQTLDYKFEDRMPEALLALIFEHLSLQVRSQSAPSYAQIYAWHRHRLIRSMPGIAG